MADVSDMDLLGDYARRGAEKAFAEVVRRHVNLVYSVALRRSGSTAHAEEITQAVFIILARKADSLRPGTVLEGWLHETTRLTALRFLRGERRRQFREQEAYMQSTIPESADASTWNQLAPLLDEAMSSLGDKDRDAVVLRFFNEKSLREVAVALRINEPVAQKRVQRALEKLRKFFTKRGVVSTTAIIAGSISAHSVQAAPAALAKTVTVAALAKGALAGGSTLTLVTGTLKAMAWSKAKAVIIASVGVLLVGGTTTVVVAAKNRAERDKDFIIYEVRHQSLLQKVFRLRANENDLRHRMVGAWQIAADKSWGATKVRYYPKDMTRQKIFTLTNWTIVHYDDDSNAVVEASGPYTLHSNLYTETIETADANMAKFLGARPRFNVRVEGDKYYQVGLGVKPSIEEMWQRVRR